METNIDCCPYLAYFFLDYKCSRQKFRENQNT